MKTILTISLLATAMVATSYSQALIYESFNFGADGDALNGQTTGDGLTGTWNANSVGQVQVDAPGHTYGSLATEGNRITMDDGRGAASTGTTLNGFLDNGDTLWFSTLISLNAIGGNADFGFALGTSNLSDSNNVPMNTDGSTTPGEGLGFRFKGGLQATSWDNGAATSGSGASVSTTTLYLVVGEMIFGAADTDADTINLYLADTDLNLGSVVSTRSAILDQTVFDTVTFANKADTTGDRLDEIRFGTTSNDVLIAVPEPGSFALLGGLLALTSVMLRRRRS